MQIIETGALSCLPKVNDKALPLPLDWECVTGHWSGKKNSWASGVLAEFPPHSPPPHHHRHRHCHHCHCCVIGSIITIKNPEEKQTQKRYQQFWLLSIPNLSNIPEVRLPNGDSVHSSDQGILRGGSWLSTSGWIPYKFLRLALKVPWHTYLSTLELFFLCYSLVALQIPAPLFPDFARVKAAWGHRFLSALLKYVTQNPEEWLVYKGCSIDIGKWMHLLIAESFTWKPLLSSKFYLPFHVCPTWKLFWVLLYFFME